MTTPPRTLARLMHTHSPLQIEVLLHHYYSPNAWSNVHGDSPAAKSAHDYWIGAKCLKSIPPWAGSCSGHELTDKGHAMVALWLRQPLPKVETVYLDGDGRPIDIGDHP